MFVDKADFQVKNLSGGPL